MMFVCALKSVLHYFLKNGQIFCQLFFRLFRENCSLTFWAHFSKCQLAAWVSISVSKATFVPILEPLWHHHSLYLQNGLGQGNSKTRHGFALLSRHLPTHDWQVLQPKNVLKTYLPKIIPFFQVENWRHYCHGKISILGKSQLNKNLFLFLPLIWHDFQDCFQHMAAIDLTVTTRISHENILWF